MQNLIAFINRYLGVMGTGDTADNKGQCVGLIECWCDVNGKPHIWGNAVDLMRNADPVHYSVTPNSPTNFPPPGAILCFDSTWGGGYGHTGVVVAATESQIVLFEQNNPEGGAPAVATHTYQGVAGWITIRQ